MDDESRKIPVPEDSLVPSKKPRTDVDDAIAADGGAESSVTNDEEDSGNISESSDASSSDWQDAPSGAMAWVHTQMVSGVDPRQIIRQLMPEIKSIPSTVSNLAIWKLIVSVLCEPPRRHKLPEVNTLEQVVNLIRSSKNILVLTGAGVSVSCGIPDFRSKDGVYARLAVDFPDLPDPQAMFDMQYFLKDPRPFFKFAKEIYPGQFQPSRSHKFINLLEKTNRLLRNYTQNIDTLEQVAGIKNVVQCHGSFATASCLNCKRTVDCETIREDIFKQAVPHCTVCPAEDPLAIMKPDIVFFGESLPQRFHKQMAEDKHKADLLIVIGSSLKVRPVALIPNSLPHEIPQVLINREPLHHLGFDVELLGNGDTVVAEICRRLGGEFMALAQDEDELKETKTLPQKSPHKRTVRIKPTETPDSKPAEQTAANDQATSEDTSCSSKTIDDSHENNEQVLKEQTKDNDHSSNNESSINDNEGGSSPATAAAENELQNLWQSRWKESISKRLPSGHFFYNGAHRYVFPGAEVAPEEDSDLESSSDESEDDDKEKEDEEKGPGGLSATRRDLSTNPTNPIHRMLMQEDEEEEGCCFHHHHHHDDDIHDHDDSHDNGTMDQQNASIGQDSNSSSSHIVPDEFVDMVADHKPLQVLEAPQNVESILELDHSSNNVVFTPEKEVPLSDIEDVLNGSETQCIETMTTHVHINEDAEDIKLEKDKNLT